MRKGGKNAHAYLYVGLVLAAAREGKPVSRSIAKRGTGGNRRVRALAYHAQAAASRTLLVTGLWAMFLILLMTALSPAAAQQATKQRPAQATIKLFDATAVVPLPSWQKGTDVAADSEVSRRQNQQAFILEFIPKNEEFTAWSRLYAVRADVAPKVPLVKAINAQISLYAQVCGKDRISLQKLSSSKTHFLFVLMCPSSPNGPANLGYGPNIGEISVFWMTKHKDTIVKVFHHWRGASFNNSVQTSWPVDKDTVQRVIGAFGAIRVF